MGDLAGIIEQLDYVEALGVDTIWLSPIFASPMKDFGYDVSDYTAIHPDFGTLETVAPHNSRVFGDQQTGVAGRGRRRNVR